MDYDKEMKILGLSQILAGLGQSTGARGSLAGRGGNTGMSDVASSMAQSLTMKRQQEEAEKEKKSGLLGSLGSVLGGAAGFAVGGPIGAAAGSALGGSGGRLAGGGGVNGTDVLGYGMQGAMGGIGANMLGGGKSGGTGGELGQMPALGGQLGIGGTTLGEAAATAPPVSLPPVQQGRGSFVDNMGQGLMGQSMVRNGGMGNPMTNLVWDPATGRLVSRGY